MKRKKLKSVKPVPIKRVDLFLDVNTDPNQTSTSSRLPEVSAPDVKFNMYRLIKSILKSDLGVPLDVKINDSHLPTAPNFVTFLNGAEFLKVKGFARQNEIPTKLFQEYCPHCTDLVWFENVPVDASLKLFKKKVTLLVYGKCPKCGAKRSDMINNGELKPYQELAGLAGQRSAKSHMIAMIAAYIVHRFLKLQNPIQLLGLNAGTILHGTFVALTYAQAKETLWDPFYEYLAESPWFCIAKGTEITLADGSKKLIEDICPGDLLRTLEGPEKAVQLFNNGVKECFEISLDTNQQLPATDKHQVRVFENNRLVWKKVSELREGDEVVVE
jgi:hypothetical protein